MNEHNKKMFLTKDEGFPFTLNPCDIYSNTNNNFSTYPLYLCWE